jgi:hypothetical protein
LFRQAAGSGSESASKIKEGIGNKRDSDNFDKYIKTGNNILNKNLY